MSYCKHLEFQFKNSFKKMQIRILVILLLFFLLGGIFVHQASAETDHSESNFLFDIWRFLFRRWFSTKPREFETIKQEEEIVVESTGDSSKTEVKQEESSTEITIHPKYSDWC